MHFGHKFGPQLQSQLHLQILSQKITKLQLQLQLVF